MVSTRVCGLSEIVNDISILELCTSLKMILAKYWYFFIILVFFYLDHTGFFFCFFLLVYWKKQIILTIKVKLLRSHTQTHTHI